MKARALALLLCLSTPLGAGAAADAFPRPPELDAAVEFWVTIYSDVPTSAGLLHDPDDLSIVYERLRFDEAITRAQRSRLVRERKADYRELLRAIAAGERDDLSQQQRAIRAQFPDGVSDARLRRAARNIRFQLGQSDKFRAGLVRSGAWEPHIRRTLQQMGLPRELAALPHVESSFNPNARSAAGAAGIWQFTRATGQRYMRIDRIVDARLDPFKSSIAAARLLAHNHSITDNWPLALTAYNHGLAGVRRAAEAVGTRDFGEIATQYEGRNWGFASRNFYAAFLAAVEVDFNAQQYFDALDRRDPIASETIELPFFAAADDLAQAFEVSQQRLRALNRALRDPVWDATKRVPRGYDLRVPTGPERPAPATLLARVEPEARYYAQIPDRYHRVQRGEALSTIAQRYDVATQRLVALNNLSSAHNIHAGQRLRLPIADAGARDASDPVYTVQAGDTLSGIAQRAGMSTRALARRNDLDPSATIRPGQQVRVDSRPQTAQEPARRAAAGAGASDGDAAPASSADAAHAFAMNAPHGPDATGPATPRLAETDANGFEADGRARINGGPARPQRIALSGGIEAAASSASPESAFAEEGEAGQGGAGERPELAADPADYGVREDGTIEIQAAETLGHYAEWLDMRASQLRRLNGLRYGDPVVIGRRLELDFSRVTPERFEKRRLDHHEALQRRFFQQFQITGTERQVVERGDSLWSLAQRADNLPVWLLRQYNPDLDFSELRPGMPVTLPQLAHQPQAEDASGGQQTAADDDTGANTDAGT
jgi:membrane-bound lytic murein transglycosylase D